MSFSKVPIHLEWGREPHCFRGPTPVSPNGVSIGSSVSAQPTPPKTRPRHSPSHTVPWTQSHRESQTTPRETCVPNGRDYARVSGESVEATSYLLHQRMPARSTKPQTEPTTTPITIASMMPATHQSHATIQSVPEVPANFEALDLLRFPE